MECNRSPVYEKSGRVALEIKIAPDPTIASSPTFRSPDATVISLRFEVAANDEDEDKDGDEDELET